MRTARIKRTVRNPYDFASQGYWKTTSRSSFNAAPLPEYFVRTTTVTLPAGTVLGTRAMSWLGLLTDRRCSVLCSLPSAATKNTPCAASSSLTLSLSPSMRMSSPIVSVPSFKPVAVSVMAAIRAYSSFTPSTLTEISSSAFRSSAVGTMSTVRLWIFSSYGAFSVSHTPETRGLICTAPSIKLKPS